MQGLLPILHRLMFALHPVLTAPWFWVGLLAVSAWLASVAALLTARAVSASARIHGRPYLQVSEWASDVPTPETLATHPFRLRLMLTNSGQIGAFLGDSRCRLLLNGKLAGEALPPVAAALLFPKSEMPWVTELPSSQYPIAGVLAGQVSLGVDLELQYRPVGVAKGSVWRTTIHAEFRPGFGWVTLEASAT